jgi:hypothetical protein
LSGNGRLLSTYKGEDMNVSQLVRSTPSGAPIENPKSKFENAVKPFNQSEICPYSRRIKVNQGESR